MLEDDAVIDPGTYSQIDAVLNGLYGTFQLNFHHFDRIELGLRGYSHVRGADFSCLRLKLADVC